MPDLKTCPIMVLAENMKSAYCIGKDCSWWCEFAQDCAVPLISGILADSSICMTGWNCRAGEEDKEELLLKLDNDFCSYGERKEGAGNG